MGFSVYLHSILRFAFWPTKSDLQTVNLGLYRKGADSWARRTTVETVSMSIGRAVLYGRATEHRLQSQVAWVQIPARPLTGSVIWGKSLNLSVPWFPHLQNKIIIIFTLATAESSFVSMNGYTCRVLRTISDVWEVLFKC